MTGRTRVTPHVLRHTAATWLAMRGIPLARIAMFLGQTVERTTERYLHWTPEFQEDVRAALDREQIRPRLVAAGGATIGLAIDND